jgi:hypothetical protein
MRTKIKFIKLTAVLVLIALIALAQTRTHEALSRDSVTEPNLRLDDSTMGPGASTGETGGLTAQPQATPKDAGDFPLDCPVCPKKGNVAEIVWKNGEPVGPDNKQYRCVVAFHVCGSTIYQRSAIYDTEDKSHSCDDFNKEADKRVGTTVCCPDPRCLQLEKDVSDAYKKVGLSNDTADAAGNRAWADCERKKCDARQNPNRKPQPPEGSVSCPEGVNQKCCDLFLAIIDAYKKAGAGSETQLDAADAALIECQKKNPKK